MPRHLPSSTTRAQLGRRSLVRTGVTAAWAVPAVTVAAAAPAFAACSGDPDLSGSSHATATRSGKTVTIEVALANGGATTSGLSLSVSGPDALHTLDQLSATGWSTATAGAGGSITLSSVATSQLVCGATPTAVAITVTLHSNAANQVLSFVFTGTSGVGYTFAVTV